MTDLLTEFTFIDPDEMHLVKTPANAFDTPLLAKAAEALTEATESLIKEFVDGLCGISGCEVCHERFVALKGDETNIEKAKLRAKDRKALSDSDFAYIDSKGGRHLPIHDESHVRNALSRFNQTHFESTEAKEKARRKIVARAKEMGIEVSDDDKAAKQTAPDKSVPEGEALAQTNACDTGPQGPGDDNDADDGGEPKSVSFPHGPEGDGQGDSAPDKSLPTGEAESQTSAMKSDVDMTGDKAGSGDDAAARSAAESQTASTPASSSASGETAEEREAEAYANKVAELGEIAKALLERENTGTATKRSRKLYARVRSLLEHPELIKEIGHMPTSDVLKELDEQEDARRAEKEAQKAQKKAFKKAVRKEAEKLAKKAAEAEAAKGADDASKAADPEPADEPKLSKKELEAEVADLRKQVSEFASQAGHRVPVNAAGVTAILRGPEGESVLKQFDAEVEAAQERLTKASSEIERDRAEQDLNSARVRRTAAKLVAQSNAQADGRLRTRFGPNSVELFKGVDSIPEDTSLRYR